MASYVGVKYATLVSEEYRQIDDKVRRMCAEADASLTILRPTMIYGSLNDRNLSVFIHMVDKLRLFPVVSGAKYELQPVWCKALGDAYYSIMMHPETTEGKEYNLSGSQVITIKEMLIEIGEQLGVKNPFILCPFWLAYTA